MTAPSNANTSGLAIVAWRWKGFDGYFVVNPNQPKPFEAEPLVTAASAQARIAELEESDKNARENWDGIIGPLSTYASSQDDYDPILDAAPDGGPDVVGQTFIALLEARKDRATAAEARADRLAKALGALQDLFAREGECSMERFERIAEMFRKDTGYLAPGKDPGMLSQQPEGDELRRIYDDWYAGKIKTARAALQQETQP